MDSDRCHCGSCGTQITMEKSWQYHLQKTFVKKLQELYDAEQFWDVKIVVHGKEYKCHRLVLSAHSEYFKTLFTSGTSILISLTISHKETFFDISSADYF